MADEPQVVVAAVSDASVVEVKVSAKRKADEELEQDTAKKLICSEALPTEATIRPISPSPPAIQPLSPFPPADPIPKVEEPAELPVSRTPDAAAAAAADPPVDELKARVIGAAVLKKAKIPAASDTEEVDGSSSSDDDDGDTGVVALNLVSVSADLLAHAKLVKRAISSFQALASNRDRVTVAHPLYTPVSFIEAAKNGSVMRSAIKCLEDERHSVQTEAGRLGTLVDLPAKHRLEQLRQLMLPPSI